MWPAIEWGHWVRRWCRRVMQRLWRRRWELPWRLRRLSEAGHRPRQYGWRARDGKIWRGRWRPWREKRKPGNDAEGCAGAALADRHSGTIIACLGLP